MALAHLVELQMLVEAGQYQPRWQADRAGLGKRQALAPVGQGPSALVQPRCSSGATRAIRAMGLSSRVSHWRAGPGLGTDLSSCSRK